MKSIELLKVSHDRYILVKAKYFLALAQIFFFFKKKTHAIQLMFILSNTFFCQLSYISPVYLYILARYSCFNFRIHLSIP